MRRALLGLLGVVIAGDAFAADWLRGSSYEGPSRYEEVSGPYNWGGVYFGGQAAYTNASFDMSGASQQMVRNLTRQSFLEVSDEEFAAGNGFQVSKWLGLPRIGASGVSYGGFVGYNVQWGSAVMGVEANYNMASGLAGVSSDAISRWIVVDDYRYHVSVSGSAEVKVTDFGSVRARAGYAVGAFLPFVTAGVAFGRADYSRSASISYPRPQDLDPDSNRPNPCPLSPPAPPNCFDVSNTESKKGVFTVGYSVGAGVDVGLLPNVFLRGEYEFVSLSNFGGISADLHNFRTAAALKF